MGFVRVIGLSGDIKNVPKSSFESYLKDIGYRELSSVIRGNEWEQKEEVVTEHTEEIESIPISEMSGKQLREYAKLKGIDVSTAKNSNEAREIIREHIQEEGA